MLSGLETEKRYHQKMVQEHKNAQEAVQKEFMELQEQLDQNRKKAKLLQQQAEEQNKWLQLGQRMEKYLNRFQPNARKRKENDALLDEVRAFFLKSTVKPKVQTKPKRKPSKAPLPPVQFKAGDKVRIVGTKQSGLIESIERNKANLSVNSMKLSVSLDKLMPF